MDVIWYDVEARHLASRRPPSSLLHDERERCNLIQVSSIENKKREGGEERGRGEDGGEKEGVTYRSFPFGDLESAGYMKIPP